MASNAKWDGARRFTTIIFVVGNITNADRRNAPRELFRNFFGLTFQGMEFKVTGNLSRSSSIYMSPRRSKTRLSMKPMTCRILSVMQGWSDAVSASSNSQSSVPPTPPRCSARAADAGTV